MYVRKEMYLILAVREVCTMYAAQVGGFRPASFV